MKLKCKGSRILLDFIANFSMNIYKLKKKTKNFTVFFFIFMERSIMLSTKYDFLLFIPWE